MLVTLSLLTKPTVAKQQIIIQKVLIGTNVFPFVRQNRDFNLSLGCGLLYDSFLSLEVIKGNYLPCVCI